MKQISVLIIFCFMANLIFAQTAVPTASGDNLKKMTVAEANALNGTGQATINGKPYSQYKAEQDALKNKQQAVKPNSINPGSVTLGGTENMKPIDEPQKAAITKAPPAAKPVDTKGTSLEVKPIKPSAENKQEAQGSSSTDPAPAAKKTVATPQGGGN